MEENEIMNTEVVEEANEEANEEVIDWIELEPDTEVTESSNNVSVKSLAVVAGIALLAGCGVAAIGKLVYKKALKPLGQKIKYSVAKKKGKKTNTETEGAIDIEFTDVETDETDK